MSTVISKDERLRILRLALSTFVVESSIVARELRKNDAQYMATAIDREIEVASKLLADCATMPV